MRKRIFVNIHNDSRATSASKFKKLLTWNNYSTVDKMVTASDMQSEVIAATIIDEEDKLGIRLYKLKATSTFKSAFLKSSALGVIYLYKDTNKLWTLNHRVAIQYILADKELQKNLGLEWVEGLEDYIFTKPVIKAVLRGLCTNRDDAVSRYYKSLGVKGVNFRRFNQLKQLADFRRFEVLLRVTTNIDNLYKFADKPAGHNMQLVQDTAEMAMRLGKKVNFAWSPKRMKAEHDAMALEIVAIKSKFQEHKVVDYNSISEVPKHNIIEVLSSNTELLEESIKMGHCVGTSDYYFEQMQQLSGLIIRYKNGDTLGTAQVNIQGEEFRVNQFYGRFNGDLPIEHENILMDTLKGNEFTRFIKQLKEHKGSRREEYSFKDDYAGQLPF